MNISDKRKRATNSKVKEEKARPQPTFKPRINQKSQKIAANMSYQSVSGKGPEDRLYSQRNLKNDRFEIAKSKIEAQRMAQCTFKPQVDEM